MGHIELSLPVYHPLLFDLLYKLVKAKCFVCHKFRCNRLKLKLVLTKLRLLDAGLLLMAKSVDDLALKSVALGGEEGDEKKSKRSAAAGGSKKKKKSKDAMDDDAAQEDEEEESEPLEDQSDAVKNRLDELLQMAETNIRKYGRVAPTTSKKDGKKKQSGKRETGIAREPTSHELTFRREVVASFFHEIQSKKCHSCGAFSPALRRDGHTKMFRLPLTKAQQQSMDLLNLRFDDVLSLTEGGYEKGSEAWAKMMKERNFYKEYQAILRKKKEEKKKESQAAKKKKEKKRAKKAESTDAAAEDDIDPGQEDEPSEGSDAEADKSDSSADSSDDGEEDDEEAEEDDAEEEAASSSKSKKAAAAAAAATPSKKSKKSKKEAAAAAAQTAIDSDEEEIDDGRKVLIAVQEEDDEGKRVPVLLFPNEVEKHVEMLWQQEAEVLSTLWGSMCDLLQHDERSGATETGYYAPPANNFRMFFLRVLSVPPSRFRPPTRFGDMLVDHPQNVYFKHILDMDAKLQKMQRGEVRTTMNNDTRTRNIVSFALFFCCLCSCVLIAFSVCVSCNVFVFPPPFAEGGEVRAPRARAQDAQEGRRGCRGRGGEGSARPQPAHHHLDRHADRGQHAPRLDQGRTDLGKRNGRQRYQTDVREEGGSLPPQHDGQARQLRCPLCHFARPLHQHGRGRCARAVRHAALLPRAGHAVQRGHAATGRDQRTQGLSRREFRRGRAGQSDRSVSAQLPAARRPQQDAAHHRSVRLCS